MLNEINELSDNNPEQMGGEECNCTYCSNYICISVPFTYTYQEYSKSKNKILNDPNTIKYPFAIECEEDEWYLFCRKACYIHYKRMCESTQGDIEMESSKKFKFN